MSPWKRTSFFNRSHSHASRFEAPGRLPFRHHLALKALHCISKARSLIPWKRIIALQRLFGVRPPHAHNFGPSLRSSFPSSRHLGSQRLRPHLQSLFTIGLLESLQALSRAFLNSATASKNRRSVAGRMTPRTRDVLLMINAKITFDSHSRISALTTRVASGSGCCASRLCQPHDMSESSTTRLCKMELPKSRSRRWRNL